MVAVAAAVAATAPPALSDAASSTARWRMWRITRVGAAARPIGMIVDVKGSAQGSLALVVAVRGSGSSRRVVTSSFWEDGGTDRAVYRDGSATPACPIGTCTSGDPGLAIFHIGTNQPVRDEYLVLAWGATARTTFDRDRPGWRVREVTAPPVRRVLAVAAHGTGATLGSRAVEHYEGTSAPGGAKGSLAWASAPCDGGGVGNAQLLATPAAPGAPPALDCLEGRTHVTAMASRTVRWTVTGRVIGVAEKAPLTRLLVVDLAT